MLMMVALLCWVGIVATLSQTDLFGDLREVY
jgi:hypothetical protein